MPHAAPPRVPRLTRRQGLIAAAALGPIALLAACSGEPDGEPTPGTGTTHPPPDLGSAERDLVARYEAVLSAFPDAPSGTAALLTAIRDQHAEHRDALGGGAEAPAAAGDPGAATLGAALDGLLVAERRASRQRIRECVDAGDRATARLLALVAASEAAHVAALRDVRA